MSANNELVRDLSLVRHVVLDVAMHPDSQSQDEITSSLSAVHDAVKHLPALDRIRILTTILIIEAQEYFAVAKVANARPN